MNKFKLSVVSYEGAVRPKCFFVVSLETGAGVVERYVNAMPFLLRVRLKLAKRKLARVERKVKKFLKRNKDVSK